jgi:hypothetical protein
MKLHGISRPLGYTAMILCILVIVAAARDGHYIHIIDRFRGDPFDAAIAHATSSVQNDQLDHLMGPATSFALRPPRQIQGITDFGVSPAGDLIVVDVATPTVDVYRSDGTFVNNLGSRGPKSSQYLTPTSVTITKTGYAIADFTKRRVNLYSFSGTPQGSFIYTLQNFAASRLIYFPGSDSYILFGNKRLLDMQGHESITYLHIYDGTGIYQGSHFTLPDFIARENFSEDDRALVTPLGPDSALMATPYSSDLLEVNAHGDIICKHPIGFNAARLPGPAPAPNIDEGDLVPFHRWQLSWTPIVAIASTPHHFLVEYQTFSPLRYTIHVWSKDGSPGSSNYDTNSLLLGSTATGSMWFLRNVDNIGAQQYDLIAAHLD